ncbi:S41 family peptidase [Halorhodospira halophila]|uniref:Peptidase S41 n=1 Tax=Halorhodospira halophila (strain DSM 244 / SL1) TaxID=349124 RepID=A1WTC9_HALHL|nr:S41 family peptidase [Halorhodospira halophila]ABM60941.1 peptidase S41 [Halorhodospira halophila SL1]MBK1728599.1 peptidase S41 [Halorhodospira halophila]
MRSVIPFLLVLLAGLLGLVGPLTVAAADEGETAVELPRFPSISPDGEKLVFSWGGDLWRVPAEGGTATRLTGHRLDDLHSAWSGDGDTLVFSSLRDGYLNLWRMRPDGTGLRQVTYGDRFLRHPGFGVGRDGEPLVTFSAQLEADVYRDQRPYGVAPGGGEPQRLHDAFGSEPSTSPDGRYVAFTRGGAYHGWSRRHYHGPDARDVWLYDRDEEAFSPLTQRRAGDDGQAQWLDERTLIFLSDREDNTVNLFRARVEGASGGVERLTHFDERDVQAFDVAPEAGRAVLQVWDRLYLLDLDRLDAEPEPVALRAGDPGHDRYELRSVDRQVSEAALSPDGEVMAYIAYGRVYVRHMDEHSPTRPVTPDTHARHRDLRWSPDGLRLYFTRDADGTESIYTAGVALTREEVRRGWVASGETGGAPRPARPETGADASEGQESSGGDGAAADPDDPFAPTDPIEPPSDPDPGDPGLEPALTEPDTPPEPDPQPAPDPEPVPEEADPVAPAADPDRWHDALQFTLRPLVQSEEHERDARPSPDGTRIAFRRGRGDLVVQDLDGGGERTLVEGWDATIDWRWSPDGRHIAYTQNDLDFSANVFIVPADGSAEPVNITRHPRNDLNPHWSADGRVLTFISNRSGDSYDLYRVYLDPELARYSRLELDRYYRQGREAAERREPLPVLTPGATDVTRTETVTQEEPPELELEGAWRRVERVSSAAGNEYASRMTPAGDRYVFNSAGEGLMVMNWDGSERRRLGPVADIQHLTLRGDRVVYVAGGRAGVVRLGGGEHRRPDISDRIRIDRKAQGVQKFREAARIIEEGFYRPDLKGLDWEALVSDYEALIRRARTASEFSDIANRLMGELAASHTGVSNPGPGSALREPSGRLGIRHERVELADGRPGYRVESVVPNGPAAHGPMPLQSGDTIVAIDGRGIDRDETLLQRLRGRVGDELLIAFRRPEPEGDGRQLLHTLVTPVDYRGMAELRYDAFREERRRLVDERSDGRLGYIHIQAMNQASLEAFQGSLYAAAEGKEGLIIDVRNNGGGHTTDRILTSIMAAEHAYTIPAGADPSRTGHYPQDRLDAPRYTLPINMVANEKSYSNAEILAHAFNTLERGTLVGEQTYGGVISTGRHALIDGATVRRPFRGWYLPDGTDMEHHGAEPDIRVRQRPEDEVAGRDRQLEAAVDDMLEQLDDRE